MTVKEMDKLTAHFDKYFEQDDATVLHPIVADPHIDALLYKPTEKYPFWKMATMGASDYKMDAPKSELGDRNEYIMMIDPDENMEDHDIAHWYYEKLMHFALYPIIEKSFLTYGHSIEWEAKENEEMIGGFLEFPQVINDVGILHCKLGLFKTATCLQVILINRAETDKLLEIGPQSFSEYLYPEDDKKTHFLCERKRTDKF